jgi:NADPH-dependent 2,4-dienoyl-CoA reductase/sulfur reductase-like enzyme
MHVVIIGNGVTGVSVARHLRKGSGEVRVTLVSGESDHHWSRPALMYLYMGHMRFSDVKPYEDHFWADHRIDLVRGWVERIDTEGRRLHLADGRVLDWDELVLATGSVPNRFGWPGQDLDRVHGMYSIQDLVALERATPRLKRCVVVGGGLIGIELAEMLHSRHIPVTLLVREALYWDNVLPREEAAMVVRAIERAGFDLRLQTELKEIHDDGQGAAGGVTTSAGDRIDCQFVGLTAGVRPNLSLVRDSPIETDRGVLVDEQLRASVPHVWAAGDCAQITTEAGERYLQQVWYTGKAQGEVLAANLLGAGRRYDRGVWFNSAKFLHIEYQTYGDVPNRPTDGVTHHYWEHPDGKTALRLVERGGAFVGLNAMGLRIRHRVAERWIRDRATIAQVLDHLDEAHFDPELHRRHTAAIRAALRRPR